MREWEIGAVENIHGALPYIRFAPILALVGVGLNRIGKVGMMAIKDTSRASTPLPAIFGHFRPMLAQTQKFPWSSKRIFRGQYELVRGSLLRVGGESDPISLDTELA